MRRAMRMRKAPWSPGRTGLTRRWRPRSTWPWDKLTLVDILTTGNPFEHHSELVGIYKMQGPLVYSKPPIEVYYHYLNCGFRIAASSGSDKMGLNPPMGSARAYVKTEGRLSYDSWVEGIRKGRTFISNYPLIEVQ